MPDLSLDQVFSGGLTIAGLIGVLGILGSQLFVLPTEVNHRSAPAPVIEKPAVGLPASIPVHLEIPDIGVSTGLIQLGKNSDGTMETPTDYAVAGWYKHSPTPGELGPAIITGHVDNYLGPAVFFYLEKLQPGQQIIVTREDGSIVNFEVNKVAVFDQQNFPTDEVYGDIDYQGLRLITCGGQYDVIAGRYSHNVVVYASYVSS